MVLAAFVELDEVLDAELLDPPVELPEVDPELEDAADVELEPPSELPELVADPEPEAELDPEPDAEPDPELLSLRESVR